MQDGPALAQILAARSVEYALDVAFADRACAQCTCASKCSRAEPAAGEVHDHGLDLDLRHSLGGMNRLTNRTFGCFEIDDDAALQTRRALMPDAQDTRHVGAAAQRSRSLRPASTQRRRTRSCWCRYREPTGSRSCARRAASGAVSDLDPRELMCRPPCRALFSFSSTLARADAASSVRRTTTRSAMRRSIASTSFSRIFCSRSSLTSRAIASGRAALRQAHVHAVIHLQVPAPPGHQGAGADTALERARGFEKREIFVVARDLPVADDERKVDEALVLHQVDDRAVGGDDEELAVELPQGVGLALGEA